MIFKYLHIAQVRQGGLSLYAIVFLLKFSASRVYQNGFSVEVSVLPKVTKARASPKLSSSNMLIPPGLPGRRNPGLAISGILILM